LVGLQRTTSQFLLFSLFIVTLSVTMKAFIRAIAAGLKSESVAMSISGISILVLAIYTGYAIPKPSMFGASRWLTDLNVRHAKDTFLTFR